MIRYDEKSIYIIGGLQNDSYNDNYDNDDDHDSTSNKTWIVDPTNGFKITEGPSLNKA